MKKSKIVSLALAGTLTATAILAGTYAWTSISQQAVNENQARLNPGARLHDDYNGTKGIKRVYVENYNDAVKDGDAPILVRVRLDEYMEVGTAAGKKDAGTGTTKDVTPTPTGANIDDVTTWETYIPSVTKNDDGTWSWTDNPNSAFRDYMALTFGTTKNVYYMPTFNKDHDSLEVDVNGTYMGTDGSYDSGTPFDDYKEWGEGDTAVDYEVYDGDDDAIPDNGGAYNSDDIITHTAAKIEAEKSLVISMDQWIEEGSSKLGDFWIYDTTDGWAYWANPLYPGEVTGLLLSENSLEITPTGDWYYAMNVVGQFVTVDDLGDATSGEGFYSPDAGTAPSKEAETLLKMLSSMTQKSMQAEVISGQEVAITFEEAGTDTAGTVAIVTEEVADTGTATISNEEAISLVSNENGVVTVKGHKPGVGTVIYTAADGTISVARVTVDYATYTITSANYTTGEDNEVLKWSDDDTELTIAGYYTDTTNNIWYQVEIGEMAFKGNTTLTSVIMEDGVTIIGRHAFSGCTNLSNVIISSSVETIKLAAFYNCTSLINIEIPDGVIEIEESAFNTCTSLSTVTIPDSVTSMGIKVFRYCSALTSVNLSNNITSIGSYTFEKCTSLSSIDIPDNVSSIGSYAFSGCKGLTSISIPENVRSMANHVFLDCTKLENVELSEGLTSVGQYCFYNNRFTSIEIPASLSSIGDAAFGRQGNLEEIKVAEGNGYFCVGTDGALYSKDMTRIIAYPLANPATNFTVPESVTTLSKSIFYDSNLEEIEILGEITELPQSTFNTCTKLTTVTIPDSITSVKLHVFANNHALTTINYDGTIEQWKEFLAIVTGETNFETLQSANLTVYCTDGEWKYSQTEAGTEE